MSPEIVVFSDHLIKATFETELENIVSMDGSD